MGRFPTLVYAAAGLTAFAATVASLPIWRAWCRRSGLIDEPGARKIHAESVPLAGGLAVLTGLVAAILAGLAVAHWDLPGADVSAKIVHGMARRGPQLAVILAGAVAMVILGLADDYYELPPAPKFAGQCLIALLVTSAGVRITLFVPHPWFSYFVTVLWIVTVINAINFMDNMNGLCAGLAVLAAGWLGAIAIRHDQYLVALFAVVTAASFLGFLPYNFPRATAFLGDSGSHLAGYLLAVLAILPHFYTAAHPRIEAVFSPLLVLAVPLADLSWVVLARWRRGQPFYRGDTTHLSHRLVRRGLKPAKAVVVIWGLAGTSGLLAWLLQ